MATPRRPSAVQLAMAREAKTRRTMRFLALLGGVPVFLVSVYVSYWHITSLATGHGQGHIAAHLLAISIDGSMIVSAVALIADRHAWLPRITFGTGAAFTLAANALSIKSAAAVVAYDVIAYGCAIAPAVFMLLSAEGLLRLCLPVARRPRRKAPRKPATTAVKRTASARLKAVPKTAAQAA